MQSIPLIVETRFSSELQGNIVVCGVLSLVTIVLGEPFSPTGDKTVLSQSKLFCPNDVGDKIVLSRDYTLPARGTGLRLSRCLSGHTKIFFSIERDWPSRRGSSRLLRTDNLRHLDFSQRRNENSDRIIRSGSSRHDWTDLFLLYHFLTKKKMEARTTRQTWFFPR